MIHKEIVLKSFPTQPMHTPHLPTQPCDPFPLDELQHHMLLFFICEWFLMFWAASNIYHWWGEGSWQSQGEYRCSMLVPLFYRMVGGWVYTIKLSKAHFLNLSKPALTSTPMDRNPQVAPQFTELRVASTPVALDGDPNWTESEVWSQNTIYYIDNIVRNLL
jgi:hypothetical protein